MVAVGTGHREASESGINCVSLWVGSPTALVARSEWNQGSPPFQLVLPQMVEGKKGRARARSRH